MAQVDGEQDIVEPSKVKTNQPVLAQVIVNGIPQQHINGDSGSGSSSSNGGGAGAVGAPVGGAIIKLEPNQQVIVNGDGVAAGAENSILARHLSLTAVAKPAVVVAQPAGGPAQANNDRLYSCDMCSAKLKNKRNFETHMKRHRGELPFKCDECPKTFQGRRDLETHKRSRHDPSKKPKTELPDLELARPATLTGGITAPTLVATVSDNTASKPTGLSLNAVLPSGLISGEWFIARLELYDKY